MLTPVKKPPAPFSKNGCNHIHNQNFVIHQILLSVKPKTPTKSSKSKTPKSLATPTFKIAPVPIPKHFDKSYKTPKALFQPIVLENKGEFETVDLQNNTDVQSVALENNMETTSQLSTEMVGSPSKSHPDSLSFKK
ncbi:hypothetical protein J6590_043206 [Homalodisca vitripennis]|nr:hypothetical protein J6590_043206 [Homalodisca vitripennis]